MATIKQIKAVKPGDRVAVSFHADATWFTVRAAGKFTLEIQEANMYRPQFIDRYTVARIKEVTHDSQ